MNSTTFFVRPCPSCGRSTQIRIDFLGQEVCCQHCLRQFTAEDPEAESAALDDPVQYWIHYTDHESSGLQTHQEFTSRNPR